MRYLLYFFLLLVSPSFVCSYDLTKLGVYDFNELMRAMIDQPTVREKFPDALKEPYFVYLMLTIQQAQTIRLKPPTWDNRIQNNITHWTLDSLISTKKQIAVSYQESSNMKDSILLSLVLANRHRGFNIILKSNNKGVLYSNTDISKQMASVLANYLETKNKQADAANIEEKN